MSPGLSRPTRYVYEANLVPVGLSPSKLLRVSWYETGEPHFGRTGINRFDDPLRQYGTCYFGFSLHCAFAETVLHNETAEQGGFVLSPDSVDRWVHEFAGEELLLADLTGAPLRRLGADGQLSTIEPYDIPQSWSQEIHANGLKVDGFFYISRNCNTERAVVLFNRAAGKLRSVNCIRLPDHADFDAVVADFGIEFSDGLRRR